MNKKERLLDVILHVSYAIAVVCFAVTFSSYMWWGGQEHRDYCIMSLFSLVFLICARSIE